jgi:hypothetical protein
MISGRAHHTHRLSSCQPNFDEYLHMQFGGRGIT